MTKVLNQDQIDKLKKAIHDHPFKRHNMHGTHVIGRAQSAPENAACIEAWRELLGQDLWNDLEKITYPLENPIIGMVGNIYEEGTYFGLHIDGVFSEEWPEKGVVSYTNLIVLERSPDLDGGYLVKTDLSLLDTYLTSTIQFKQTPLELLDLQEGEMTVWDNTTIHGVTQIKKGHRITLGVGKFG